MIRLFLLGLALVALPLAPRAQESNVEAGTRAYQAGDFALAAEAFEDALRRTLRLPRHPQ